MNLSVFADMTARLQSGKPQRFIALTNNGSSSFPTLYYWFDIFAKAIIRKYSTKHQFLNTDYYKNTTILLNKLDTDGTYFQPDMAIVLIGGTELEGPDNRKIPPETIAANLRAIHHLLQEANCATVFMTYYLHDSDKVEPSRMNHICECMDIVRSAALETGAGLIDHMCRWEKLRTACPQSYQLLMQDSLHANARGNLVMALDMARYFDAVVPVGLSRELDDALAVQELMDRFENT
jgi:hypothetical protein